MVCSGVDWWVACVRVRVRAAGEEVRVRRVHSRALLQKSFILLYLLLDSPDTHIYIATVRLVPGAGTATVLPRYRVGTWAWELALWHSGLD